VGQERELAGEKVSIIGLAESGRAAARLALDRGGDVHVSDLNTDDKTRTGGAELRSLGADVELGSHGIERMVAADAVIVSPGIPPQAPVLRELRDRGVRWISEPEFAFRFIDGALIAVTGTNGKTTTAALTAHLLREAGVSVALGGNIGKAFGPPMSDLVRHGGAQWYVVELSSFQLADIDALRPDIGVVTNLSPDHLDRYASVEAYYADKARLFQNADADSKWVLPAGDGEVEALSGDAPGRRFLFGTADEAADAAIMDGQLVLTLDGLVEPLGPPADLPLLGGHNVKNALAAALTARLAGAEAADIGAALRSAPVLPNRMERVGEVDGVLWVNDSKATNVAAACAAIDSLAGPLVVLLGGKDKGESFSSLSTALLGKSTAIYTFGEAGERIQRELGADLSVARVPDLGDALEIAAATARSGDTVLMTPACSSYDEFENYEARGEAFRAWVSAFGEEAP
jgi:UDP-N-acetylmuramoylalanine--D-glutamate ligase